MVGSGHIIADRLGRVGTEENGAGVAYPAGQTLGVGSLDFEMLGRDRIDQRHRLIERAHKAGLFVHTWTFRNEQRRLVSDYAGNPVDEYLQFYRLGIDGVFSDFADTAVAARFLFELEQE